MSKIVECEVAFWGKSMLQPCLVDVTRFPGFGKSNFAMCIIQHNYFSTWMIKWKEAPG